MAVSDVKYILPSGERMLLKIASFVIPITGLILLWELGALYFDNPRILPSPFEVFDLMIQYVVEGDPRGRSALVHLRETIVRVVVASLIALSLGILIGVLTATSRRLEKGVIPWIPFWITAPTVVVILVTMIMFGFSELSVYSAVIVVSTPFVVINIWEGTRDVNPELLEMAHSFDANRVLVWKDIYLFHLMPFIFGSYRYVMGMVWKIVVLAEVFGLTVGIGTMFRFYFNFGDVGSMLAYLVLFLIVMFGIEYLVLEPLERWIFRWRDETRG